MKANSFLEEYDDGSMLSNFNNYAQSLDYNAPQIFMDSLVCDDGDLNFLSTEQEKHSNWPIQSDDDQTGLKNSTKATINIFRWEEGLKNSIGGSSDISDQQKSSQFKMQKSSTSLNISSPQNFSPQTKVSLLGPPFKNETKNIPKNFGKAIIIFIQKHRTIVEPILVQNGDNYDELLSSLTKLKKGVNSILDIRQLWEFHPSAKSIRMISNYFLRRCSLGYIYNSKILSRVCHAKYRNRFLEALRNPTNFSSIKNY